jgi:hypothetical protein
MPACANRLGMIGWIAFTVILGSATLRPANRPSRHQPPQGNLPNILENLHL